MKRPPMYRIKYVFKNGEFAEFFITNNDRNPIHRVEWSFKLNKKNFRKVVNEYFNSCIPHVYQQIANYMGQTILYIDKTMTIAPIAFKPETSLS